MLSLHGFFSHLSLILVRFWANYILFLEGHGLLQSQHVLYQQHRSHLSWLSWIALASSPSLHLAGFCPRPPQSSFQHVLFAAHGKRTARCRRKLRLWHFNRYRSEQALGSGTLWRHLAFTFRLSALWFVIISANSLVSENLLFSASHDESFRPVVNTRYFFPLEEEKDHFLEAVFCLCHCLSCPCFRTILWASGCPSCLQSPCESPNLAWDCSALSKVHCPSAQRRP